MPFEVSVHPSIARQGARLSAAERRRLYEAIASLAEAPHPRGSRVKRLQTKEALLRLRVGDWRLPFRIKGNVVEVLALIHRSELERWLRSR